MKQSLQTPLPFNIENYKPDTLCHWTLLDWFEQFIIRYFLLGSYRADENADSIEISRLLTYPDNLHKLRGDKGRFKIVLTIKDSAILVTDPHCKPDKLYKKMHQEIFSKGKVNLKKCLTETDLEQLPYTGFLFSVYVKLQELLKEGPRALVEVDEEPKTYVDKVVDDILHRYTISFSLAATKCRLLDALDEVITQKQKELCLKAESRTSNILTWANLYVLAYMDYELWCRANKKNFKKAAFITLMPTDWKKIEDNQPRNKRRRKNKECGEQEPSYSLSILRSTESWSKKILSHDFLIKLLSDALLIKDYKL